MNVSKYAVILAEALGMNSNDIEIIRDAGLLHDIGKISIPERILQKTSKLTDEEYAIMKTHVENSTKMIRYLPDMDYVIPPLSATMSVMTAPVIHATCRPEYSLYGKDSHHCRLF